ERSSHGSASLHIRYEDLIADPVGALGRVGDLIGLDFRRIAESLVNGGELPTGHGISGNRVRQSGRLSLRPDKDGPSPVPTSVRAAAALAAPIAHRYGYRVLRDQARRGLR